MVLNEIWYIPILCRTRAIAFPTLPMYFLFFSCSFRYWFLQFFGSGVQILMLVLGLKELLIVVDQRL